MSDAHISRASVYLELGDAESALDDLKQSRVSWNPKTQSFFLIRGQVYLMTGDLGRAEADLLQVLEITDEPRLVSTARQILAAMP